MSKREDKRKLSLKRQRLRQLSDDQVAEVAGGGEQSQIYNYDSGRIRSRCCN